MNDPLDAATAIRFNLTMKHTVSLALISVILLLYVVSFWFVLVYLAIDQQSANAMFFAHIKGVFFAGLSGVAFFAYYKALAFSSSSVRVRLSVAVVLMIVTVQISFLLFFRGGT